MSNAADINALLAIMDDLRDPETGCPWDLQQDMRSLLPYTLEEVYEVVDAVERGDTAHLREELGDLLFQVVFYARIAAEQGLFDMQAIIDGIAGKLVTRHPHVFQRKSAHSGHGIADLHLAWEQAKRLDRQRKGIDGILGDIPLALPALQRAGKIQSRLARAGFDWTHVADVLRQVRAELDELEAAMQTGTHEDCVDELGDVLFSCVNLARHLGVDPESALRSSNAKVEARVQCMEQVLSEEGKDWTSQTMEQLEGLWQAAKQRLRHDSP